MNCSKTCPKGLNPGKAIASLKKKVRSSADTQLSVCLSFLRFRISPSLFLSFAITIVVAFNIFNILTF